jgi:flagellar protein FlbD
MICLHRLNGSPFVLNAELIETVEATPDTLISLTDGKKFVILDRLDEVIEKVVAYRRRVAHHGPGGGIEESTSDLVGCSAAGCDED